MTPSRPSARSSDSAPGRFPDSRIDAPPAFPGPPPPGQIAGDASIPVVPSGSLPGHSGATVPDSHRLPYGPAPCGPARTTRVVRSTGRSSLRAHRDTRGQPAPNSRLTSGRGFADPAPPPRRSPGSGAELRGGAAGTDRRHTTGGTHMYPNGPAGQGMPQGGMPPDMAQFVHHDAWWSGPEHLLPARAVRDPDRGRRLGRAAPHVATDPRPRGGGSAGGPAAGAPTPRPRPGGAARPLRSRRHRPHRVPDASRRPRHRRHRHLGDPDPSPGAPPDQQE